MTEHMRMSGMYWGLTALDLMGKLEETNRNEVLEFIAQCQTDSGGIAASLQHDPHILYTLSAVQILCIYNALDTIDIERVVKYVKERQQPDGSFTGDIWGGVDTRFSFCAVATLSLLVNKHSNKRFNLLIDIRQMLTDIKSVQKCIKLYLYFCFCIFFYDNRII